MAPWFAARPLGFYVAAGLIGAGTAVASIAFRLDNPRRWEILGMVLGATIGFIAEHRYVGYRTAGGSWRQRASKLAIGAAGIIACLLIDRIFPTDARVPGLFTAGIAVLWTVLVAPALFKRRGW